MTMKSGPVASGGKPYNYIIVVDAGSSGSRVHVYTYLEPFSVSKLGNKWAKKIKPGISSFAENPDKVGKKHINKLLDYAKDVVPEEQHSRTPIFLHATAGMRLLKDHESEEILQKSCEYIRKKSKFFLPDCKTQLTVIDGETEGLFGWLAMNYLIGGIDDPKKHDHGKGHSTYGFLDMGGASAQIAFVPNTTEINENKGKLHEIKLMTSAGDRVFDAYSKTFLHMGVNEARKKYVEGLDGKDPCLLKGYKDDGLEGTGDYGQCQKLIQPLLTDLKTTDNPDFDFDVNHFVGVSEYWDSTKAFELGGNIEYNGLSSKVKEFCETSWSDVSDYDMSPEALSELCFKSSYLLGVIDAFKFPKEYKKDTKPFNEYLKPLTAAQDINGVEFSWTLGRALLYASAEVGDTGVKAPGGDWRYGQERPRPAFQIKDDDDDDDDDDWEDYIERHSHRLWGSLIFLGLLLIAVWLMLGKVRRKQIWDSIKGKLPGRRYAAVGTGTGAGVAAEQRLTDAEEFELDDDRFSISDEEDASNRV